MTNHISGPGLAFHYTLLDMRRLNPEALLQSGSPESKILAILTDSAEPQTVINKLRKHLRGTDHDDRNRLKDLFLLLCTLRGHDCREELTMPLDIMDIPIIRKRVRETAAKAKADAMARGLAQGLAKGTAEGLAKGMAKGTSEGMANLLSRQLTARFGPLPTWAADRLHNASQD